VLPILQRGVEGADIDFPLLIKFKSALGWIGAAALFSLSSNGIISQRFTHDSGKDREKMSPVPPYCPLVLTGQTQKSLMDQGRPLQGVFRPLLSKITGS